MASVCIISFCCILLISSFAVLEVNGNPRRHEHRRRYTKFVEHVNRIYSEGLCSEPRPRLIYIEDLPNIEPQKLYHPPATVLHMCDKQTGCCLGSKDLQCGPQKIEEVTLVFQVIDTVNRRQVPTYEEFTFTNHTSCACVMPNESEE